LLSLLSVKSSKLFAIVKRVKGLSSNAVKSNLLKGNISFSIISFSKSILIILFELLCSEIVRPDFFHYKYSLSNAIMIAEITVG